jgi:hypothetical protein
VGMMVVLWLVLLTRVVRRSSMDGRLCALMCARMTGRAVAGTGEQRREADRDDRADLSSPPGQLGEAAKPRVPRVIPGMTGPDRVAGVGIRVCPALAPGGRRACRVGRRAGKRRVARVGVVDRPTSRTALQVPAGRRMAVGAAREGVLCCPVRRAEVWRVGAMWGMAREWALGKPVDRAEPGTVGALQRMHGVLAQAAVGAPPTSPFPIHLGGLGAHWRRCRLAGVGGVVRTLAEGCPVRAAGLPGPVVCRWFIIFMHIRQHSRAGVKCS